MELFWMLVHPVRFLIFRWGLWGVDLWPPLQASPRAVSNCPLGGGGAASPFWCPPTHWNAGVASSCTWLPTTFSAQTGALQCTGPSLTHCAVAQAWVFLSPGGPSAGALEAVSSLLSPRPAPHACFPRRDFWQRKSINYFAL